MAGVPGRDQPAPHMGADLKDAGRIAGALLHASCQSRPRSKSAWLPSDKLLQVAMENHNFLGVNQLSMAMFNSKLLVY